jgi:hypothetical protein
MGHRWRECIDGLNDDGSINWQACALAQADVHRNPIQPRPERTPALKRRQITPGTKESLLQRIFRVMKGPQQAIAMEMRLPEVRVGEPSERILVAR